MTRVLLRRALPVSLFCVLVSSNLCAQSRTNGRPPNTSSRAPISKSVDMGIYKTRMFEDDSQQVSFYLVTSWISGKKHEGMLRYKLSAWVAKAAPDNEGIIGPDNSAEAEKIVRRISRCAVTLNLYDKEDFLVRKHEVSFSVGIDEKEARVGSLLANDSFQMDAQEYREFIDSGSWSISWACPLAP